MSLNNLVKRLQDIMRNDAGINGDAQRIEQMVWILFLKVPRRRSGSFTMRITPPSFRRSCAGVIGPSTTRTEKRSPAMHFWTS